MSDKQNSTIDINELLRALAIQKKVAQAGFDWPSWHGALEKVREEVDEVEQELAKCVHEPDKINEELGDLLFAVINVVRHQGACPNELLKAATDKFEGRYSDVEAYITSIGLTMEAASDEQMEAGWQYAKQRAKLKAVSIPKQNKAH